MHTFKYRGWFIHENFNKGKVQIQCPTTGVVSLAKSVHAAKCRIGRRHNS
jgi:hypothetical protein